jgi:hypothetical protein
MELTDCRHLSLKSLQEIVNKAVSEVEDASLIPVQFRKVDDIWAENYVLESIIPLQDVFILNIEKE